MLSSFQVTGETGSSQTQTPVSPLEYSEFGPQFQSLDGGSITWEKDWLAVSSEMDIDWVLSLLFCSECSILTILQATWDAFIDGTGFEDGSV
jgi:hypothetical protein